MNRDLIFEQFMCLGVKGLLGGAHVGRFRAGTAIGDLVHRQD